MAKRVPFLEAISEKLLLKARFDSLSLQQRCTLKIMYGLPLEGEELEFWSLTQEGATYDELGYPTSVRPVPYTPQEFHETCLVYGRRASKTDAIGATQFAYEATLGGHEEYVRKGQNVVCLMIAQKVEVAQLNMPFIRAALDSSPLLSKEVVSDVGAGITLKNGLLIKPFAATIRSTRGLAVPLAFLDEASFWQTEDNAANPDVEVERAIRPAQIQFPNWKRTIASSVWSKEGVLYENYQAGTLGRKKPEEGNRKKYRNLLVCHATTAALGNPTVTRDALEDELNKDPESFKREYLSIFSDARSAYFSEPAVRKCIDRGVGERIPLPRAEHPEDSKPVYVAAMDPAFRYDAFGFCIGHLEPAKGVVIDLLRRWIPTGGVKPSPGSVLDEICLLLRAFGVKVVLSDQYQLESLQQLAQERGFGIEAVDFTGRSKPQIMGSLHTLVQQGRLRLLDPDYNKDAAVLVNELLGLEKRLTAGGSVQIAASGQKHDDMAVVASLMASRAIYLPPLSEAIDPEIQPYLTMAQRIDRHVRQRFQAREDDWGL